MTSLVDIAVAPGNLERIEAELRDAVTTGTAKTEDKTVNKTVDTLPEKLRGKSLEDIAEMYRNLESAHGRMANDLGAQRQLTDRLLDLKRNEDLRDNSKTVQKPEKVTVSAADLLEKPTEALERFADSREASITAQVNDRLSRLEATMVQREFAGKHPDASAIAQSSAFVDWVKQSPVRQRAAQAAIQGHFGAADDLLTEFKALKPATTTETPKETADGSDSSHDAARKSSLESGGTSGADPGNKQSGKVYSRVDLMRMRVEKPEEYYNEANQAVIMQAYADGRVK